MISIVTSPTSSIQSAGNSSVFVVSGSAGVTSSVFDFKYLCDVLVGGNRVTTLKTFPDANGFGMFDMNKIASNFVSYDFIYNLSQDSASIFHTADNSFASQIQLNFGKEFSLPGGGFSQSRNEVSSSVYTYINSSLPFVETNTNLAASYMVTGATASMAKFLTKIDFTIPSYNNLRSYLYFYSSGSFSTFLSVKTYDVHNNQIGFYAISNATISNNEIQIIATGYPQLSQLTSGSSDGTNGKYTVESGNPIMFNSSVVSYAIQLIGNGFVPFTETVTYQIMQDCSRFAPYAYKVYWLNSLGGFDSWLFNKVNLKTTTKTQSSFKKIAGKVNSNGSYALNTFDRGAVPYYTQLDSKIQLSTDFLTDKQVRYLKGLFSSPIVYLEDPDGVLISATIDTSDYTLNQRAINQKIFSLSLTFIPGQSDYRQSL